MAEFQNDKNYTIKNMPIFKRNKLQDIPEKVLTLYLDYIPIDIDNFIDYIKEKNIISIEISNKYKIDLNIILNTGINPVLNRDDNEKICSLINRLPNCIKYLTFNYISLDVIELISLPKDLIYLDVGVKFNNNIDMLPQNLKVLILGYQFNKPLNNLPPLLESLFIGGHYNHTIDNLPDSIKYLYMDTITFNIPINKLPHNLVHLSISLHIVDIEEFINIFKNIVYPDTLESLDLCYFKNYAFYNDDLFEISNLNLPKKLKEFSLREPINTILNKSTIPENTEKLILNACFNLDNLIELPLSVKECRVSRGFPILNSDYDKIARLENTYPHCYFHI